MSYKVPLLISFIIIFNYLPAIAEVGSFEREKTAQTVLTLEDAIKEATANNPLLSAFREESVGRKANIEPQAALEDPGINLELEDYPASNFSPRTQSSGNKISVRQKLPFPGKRSALREAATEEYLSSENDLESKRLEVIANLKKTYFELSFAFASIEVIKEQLKLVRSTLELSRSNFSLGKAPQSDVLTLQVEEATFLDKQVQIKRQIDTLGAELNHLLGRSSNESWIPEPIMHERKLPPLAPEENLIEQALLANPGLKSFKAQANAAKAKEKYSRLNLYPDLDLMAGYTIRHSNDFDNGGDEVSAGVGVTIPLWRSMKQDQLIEKASADKRKSEAHFTETKNEIIHGLHQVLAEIRESEARRSLAKNALLPLTHAAIVSAEKAYEVGSVQLTSVLNLIRSRYEAQLNYQQALTQHEIKIAELEKLLGGSLELSGE